MIGKEQTRKKEDVNVDVDEEDNFGHKQASLVPIEQHHNQHQSKKEKNNVVSSVVCAWILRADHFNQSKSCDSCRRGTRDSDSPRYVSICLETRYALSIIRWRFEIR